MNGKCGYVCLAGLCPQDAQQNKTGRCYYHNKIVLGIIRSIKDTIEWSND